MRETRLGGWDVAFGHRKGMPAVDNSLSERMTAVGRAEESTAARAGRFFLVTSIALFALIALPVVWRGAPLADDFRNCVGVQQHGIVGYYVDSSDFLGNVRPARFLEVALIGSLCHRVPFGFVILIPLGLAMGVAFLVRGLLRDLSLPAPWPDIGGGWSLLAPLGTESALWPSALHVPLGLGFAVLSLRCVRRADYVWAILLGIAACLCVEQVIFALPLAAWMVSKQGEKKRGFLGALIASALVLFVYAMWHGGQSYRVISTPGERIHSLIVNPQSYAVVLPAIGLGLHSIPVAVVWAFPFGLPLLVAGLAFGWVIGPTLLCAPGGAPTREPLTSRGVLALLLLVILISLPIALTPGHSHSPRIFAPIWLVLVAFGAVVGSRITWRRPRLGGAVGGVLLACVLLSLSLSVWVRIRSADRIEAAAHALAERLPHGGVIAVCDVQRAMVIPAPHGDFAAHPFIIAPIAKAALRYYTGVTADFRIGGSYWGTHCPDALGADLTIPFRDLVRAGGAR